MWIRIVFHGHFGRTFVQFHGQSSVGLLVERLKKFLGDAESRDKFEYIEERMAKKLQECTSHYDLCDQGI